jgi:hypothetical protein
MEDLHVEVLHKKKGYIALSRARKGNPYHAGSQGFKFIEVPECPCQPMPAIHFAPS